ncbi:MAG TPA: hypothetical protein VKX33_11720, partial [Cyclobacteriaceae bacterium]|nr:hypothetical protein [Cyclobacteriaceae bacterium]
MYQLRKYTIIILIMSAYSCTTKSLEEKGPAVLNKEDFKFHVDLFNQMEEETIVQAIPNDQ